MPVVLSPLLYSAAEDVALDKINPPPPTNMPKSMVSTLLHIQISVSEEATSTYWLILSKLSDFVIPAPVYGYYMVTTCCKVCSDISLGVQFTSIKLVCGMKNIVYKYSD